MFQLVICLLQNEEWKKNKIQTIKEVMQTQTLKQLCFANSFQK